MTRDGRRDGRRQVRALLNGKAIPPGEMDEQEAQTLRTAVELRSARLGSGAPSEMFISRLRDRLATEMGTAAPRRTTALSRRQALITTGIAGAAAGAGALGTMAVEAFVDRARSGQPAAADASPEPNTAADRNELDPWEGSWTPVARLADLTAGPGVLRFVTGSVVGHLVRSAADGQVRAFTATCTHMGCLVKEDPERERFDCPCHRCSFAFDGSVADHFLRKQPAPLPTMPVRIRDDQVEVYVPA